MREWSLKAALAKGDTDEWVCGNDQNDYLCDTGDMMIDETSSVELSHISVNGTIQAGNEKAFEHIEADQKEDDEGDGDDEG